MEPLLLVPIGIGAILVNIPGGGLGEEESIFGYFLKYLIHTEIVPLLIFLGLGALTDFSPLLANPKTFLLGAAAQIKPPIGESMQIPLVVDQSDYRWQLLEKILKVLDLRKFLGTKEEEVPEAGYIYAFLSRFNLDSFVSMILRILNSVAKSRQETPSLSWTAPT